MWTYEDNYNILKNINVKHCYCDGVIIMYRLYAKEGYKLRVGIADILLETGEVIPYYTNGVAETIKYDFQKNDKFYVADPI